jgi:hypothetical protein
LLSHCSFFILLYLSFLSPLRFLSLSDPHGHDVGDVATRVKEEDAEFLAECEGDCQPICFKSGKFTVIKLKPARDPHRQAA